MKIKYIISTTIFGLVFVTTSVAQNNNPGSLWDDSAPNRLMDRKANAVGDVLTVIITESSTATSTASTSSSKTDSARVNAGIGPVLSALIPNLQSGGTFSSQGQGATARSERLLARLTVLVTGVMPNGNLIIEGTRYIQVNKETVRLVVSGIVRPDDIRFDNTILSEFVAEAQVHYEGKGTVGDRQRKGIIQQLLEWLF